MCELLGVTSKQKLIMNDFFEVFFSHSVEHKDGWGIALLDETPAVIEKEPVKAVDSAYLRGRLEDSILTASCIAHIRKASMGDIVINNTHPFCKCDNTGRLWILAHNGTIFDSDILAPYQYKQDGATDSERILLYIVDEMNRLAESSGRTPDTASRFDVIADAIKNITPGNKVNVLIYDGEYYYVHNNDSGSLHMKMLDGGVVFSTKPLETEGWNAVEANRLFVYKDGDLAYAGPKHSNTYVLDEEKLRMLYLAYSGL